MEVQTITKKQATRELKFDDVSQLELLLERSGFDFRVDPISYEVFQLLQEEVNKGIKALGSASEAPQEASNKSKLAISQPAQLNAVHSQIDEGVLEVLTMIAAQEGSAIGQHLAAIREQSLRAAISQSSTELLQSYLSDSQQRLEKLATSSIDDLLIANGVQTAATSLGKAQAIATRIEDFKKLAATVRGTFS